MTEPFLAILDPSPEVSEYLSDVATEQGFEAFWPHQQSLATRSLAVRAADALIVDVSKWGLEWLNEWDPQTLASDGPLVVLSGSCSEKALEVDARFCLSLGVQIAAILPKPLVDHEIAMAFQCLRLMHLNRAALSDGREEGGGS